MRKRIVKNKPSTENNNSKEVIQFKTGGQMKTKQLIPDIKSGGTAIPLGNNYYYMFGKKHEQGGIDIGKNLEVEGGEVMKLNPKSTRVYSSVPMLNGQSPAQLVIRGVNPNDVFKAQEEFKDINHLNDDGTMKAKSGGKFYEKVKKEYQRDNSTIDFDNFDWDKDEDFQKYWNARKDERSFNWETWGTEGLGLAGDIGGSLWSYFANNKVIDNLQAPYRPTLYTPVSIQPTKLKTKININPQIQQMNDSLAQYYQMIDNGTASSQVANARKNLGRLENIKKLNELYANKENIETELINKDKLAQQEVNKANVEQYNIYQSKNNDIMNQYYDSLADFNNTRANLKSENTTSLINTLFSGLNNTLTNIRKAYADKRNIKYISTANPQGAAAANGTYRFGGKFKARRK